MFMFLFYFIDIFQSHSSNFSFHIYLGFLKGMIVLVKQVNVGVKKLNFHNKWYKRNTVKCWNKNDLRSCSQIIFPNPFFFFYSISFGSLVKLETKKKKKKTSLLISLLQVVDDFRQFLSKVTHLQNFKDEHYFYTDSSNYTKVHTIY